MAAFQSAAIELLPATLDRLADVHPSLLVEVLEMETEPGHPASTTFEFREVRGRDDLWVAEVWISYDQGPWTSPRAGSHRSGGLNGGPGP